MGRSYKKNAKWEELNPDKIGRGHKFGKCGRSSTFRSKKDYRRKDKKKRDFQDPNNYFMETQCH